MSSSVYAKQPHAKTTPVTGLQLVNRENKGALVLDQQNAAWQFNALGFPRVDPRWYLNMAHRITNLDRATAVCNLQAIDPIVNRQYIAIAWLWAEHGFKLIHVPARRIRVDETTGVEYPNGEEMPFSDTPEVSFKYKDMTDIGIREEIGYLSGYPNVSHILLASHDVDFAGDMRQSTWGKSKKTTLLIVGDTFIAQNLQESANETINVLDYAGCYSALSLNKRQWWIKIEGLEVRRQKIEKWFSSNGIYPKYLENQFRDMQGLFNHLLHDLKLIPPGISNDARRLSFGKLKLAIHKFWREEKIMAELPIAVVPDDHVQPSSVEAHEPIMPPAQSRALDRCLTEMINIFIQNNVLMFDYEGPTSIKLFYLNSDHPAVRAVLETGFG